MCHEVTCTTCSKPTWFGCGAHIDSALAGVPIDRRCHCKEWTQAEREARKQSGTQAWAIPCTVQ